MHLNSATTNFSCRSSLLASHGRDIIPIACQQKSSDSDHFFNRFRKLGSYSVIFIKTINSQANPLPLGRSHILHTHYFLPALSRVTPNAQGFSVVRPLKTMKIFLKLFLERRHIFKKKCQIILFCDI